MRNTQKKSHALSLTLALSALGLGAQAAAADVKVYPYSGAHLLAGQKFDLRVEVSGITAGQEATVTLDGQPVAGLVKTNTAADTVEYTLRGTALTAGSHTLVVAGAGTGSATWTADAPTAGQAKKVILFIGDGMGWNTVRAAELIAKGYNPANGLPNGRLEMETGLSSMATVTTSSYDSFLADSANTASSIATGQKVLVNALNVYPDNTKDSLDNPRVETIAEILKRTRGMGIGLVSTAFGTDATPAAFAAHTRARGDYAAIADQYFQVVAKPDVMLFGGSNDFIPQTSPGSRRKDGVNWIDDAQKAGFTFVSTRSELLKADAGKLFGLFNLSNFNAYLDRVQYKDPASLGSFTDQGTAELMARFTNDMESVSQGINILLSKVVREPLRIMSCLSVAMWLNWRLTCLTLVLVPVSIATTFRAGKIMKRAVRRSLESMSNMYKILQESLQGIKVVKAYTMERYERRRFFLETKALYKKSVRVAMIDAMSDPILEMLALTTVSIALLSGSYLVLYHTTSINFGLFRLQLASRPLEIEDLLTLYAMLAGISDPVRKLANVHSKLQRAAAAADRICALMDRRPEVADKSGAVQLPRHRVAIEFDDVVFGYNGRDAILKGLSLTVRHGETIALVGPNGCGKSTLMNLIPRFWDVKSGAIRIDGHDLRDVAVRSLRAQVGMVIQETTLFNDTVANNIAYGNRHARRDDIIAAAKRSYAHGFIMNLPEGYDTLLGEHGSGLSGGQRQRLALARAMLRDPSILILDEATSAVDIQDEALIRKAIEEFARGRTTFIITHSLAGLSFADRIVLINDGMIEAVGTEAELRRTSVLFRRLHEIQYHRESA